MYVNVILGHIMYELTCCSGVSTIVAKQKFGVKKSSVICVYGDALKKVVIRYGYS